MRALILYETMFGDSRAVAQSIGAGLGDAWGPAARVEVLEIGAAPVTWDGGVDLLVVGSPNHAFSLPRAQSRKDAAAQTRRDVISSGIGVREWLGMARLPTGQPSTRSTPGWITPGWWSGWITPRSRPRGVSGSWRARRGPGGALRRDRHDRAAGRRRARACAVMGADAGRTGRLERVAGAGRSATARSPVVGWDPWDSLDLSVLIRPTPTGVAGRFTLDVPDGLQQGRGAWGGVATGAMVAAAQMVDPGPEMAVRNLTAQLVAPVLAGRVGIVVEQLRAGSATNTLAARVLDGAGGLLAHGVVVLGAARRGESMPDGSEWLTLVPPPSSPTAPRPLRWPKSAPRSARTSRDTWSSGPDGAALLRGRPATWPPAGCGPAARSPRWMLRWSRRWPTPGGCR